MDFFGDYSIETASCHPSSIANHTDDISNASSVLGLFSPCDTRTSYPVEFANMTNLARAFGLQNLETPSRASVSELDSLDTTTLSDTPSSSAQATSSNTPRTPPCWRRRVQRQRDMHLQADPSHLRSISELVQRMVEEGSQCETTKRSRQPKPSMISIAPAQFSIEDDEDESDSELSSPRSSSGSSSNGRSPGYFEPPSPAWRRGNDYTTSSVSKDGRIQKSRPRKSPTRERR